MNVDLRAWNILSLCSGVGGLDLGVKLAVPDARVVCYVEIEAFACEVLVSRMEDKCLDEAPVWTDIKTFDGKPWRGKVDCIVGGYPCQPFSVAGGRKGADDPRHLWPHIFRIITEVRPQFCFFENVEGHLTLGFMEVRECLRAIGYEVEAGIFSAFEVGAPHRRRRLFFLAYDKSLIVKRSIGERDIGGKSKESSGNSSSNVANSERDGRIERSESYSQWGWEKDSEQTRLGSYESVNPMEHNNNKGLEGWSNDGGECRYELAPFPPGVEDEDGWRAVIECDESLEPAVQRMAHGMDGRLDSSIFAYRIDRLRAVGNGVVSLTAAFALVTLLRKIGIDLVEDLI